MNWNKVNSTLLHIIDTIRHIIIEHKPDILSIQEANLKTQMTYDWPKFKVVTLKLTNY